MKIGYARVSTAEQNLDLQRDALKAAGCEKVITDKASGATAARPGLEKVKELLRAGDTLVVWRLDRLGRSLRDLIGWMTYLDEAKVRSDEHTSELQSLMRLPSAVYCLKKQK